MTVISCDFISLRHWETFIDSANVFWIMQTISPWWNFESVIWCKCLKPLSCDCNFKSNLSSDEYKDRICRKGGSFCLLLMLVSTLHYDRQWIFIWNVAIISSLKKVTLQGYLWILLKSDHFGSSLCFQDVFAPSLSVYVKLLPHIFAIFAKGLLR